MATTALIFIQLPGVSIHSYNGGNVRISVE